MIKMLATSVPEFKNMVQGFDNAARSGRSAGK